MTALGTVIRRRVLGVVFLIVLAGLVALSISVYLKAFTPVLWVDLYTSHTGLQLNKLADVKIRGALVGEVREISSDGKRARLRLALNPEKAKYVPSNVKARLLPKTLFGEKYVSLVAPEDPARPIQDGDEITEDRSQTAIEFEKALNDLIPVLRAVKPEQLATTLTAIADGLEGRGEQLGKNLVALGEYLAEINKEMPTIKEDMRRLARVLEVYDRALPDLVKMLRNLTVTSTTVNEQRVQLRSMLLSTADLGDNARYFLDLYGARIIQLGDVSVPVTHLLARYSPEFPCTFNGLVEGERRASRTFENGRLNVALEIVRHQGKYEKGVDEPPQDPDEMESLDWGPQCWGMPNPPVPFPPAEPEGTGYDFDRERSHLPGPLGGAHGRAVDDSMLIDPTMGYAGSEEEKALVKPIVAAATGTPVTQVGDLSVLLWGPLMRGAKVNLR